jgi:hypothetical protein
VVQRDQPGDAILLPLHPLGGMKVNRSSGVRLPFHSFPAPATYVADSKLS